MLVDLHIENLAVIDEASLSFGEGLNVLTGETGAGKSIVVDALALLAGARASADLLRRGAERLVVVGRFEAAPGPWERPLREAGVAPEGELVIRREIARTGRNRVYVNDQPATLRLVTEVAGHFLRIHAQRDELELANLEFQRSLVDSLGGAGGRKLLGMVAEQYRAVRELEGRLDAVVGDDRARRERIDWLEFQIDEIRDAELSAGEEETLRRDRDALRHRETIVTNLSAALEELHDGEGSAVERLGRSRARLDELASWEPVAKEGRAALEEAEIQLTEVVSNLRDRLLAVDGATGSLDDVEFRLAVLERLFRKYGDSSAAVLERSAEMSQELEQMMADDENHEELEHQLEGAVAAYREVAGRLSKERRAWAKELVERAERELADLGLGAARLEVDRSKLRREGSRLVVGGESIEFGSSGFDRLELLLAANAGEELKTLARSASGGELSRIYLALQLAGRRSEEGLRPTMVFDEADAGLGGEAASILGRKLQRLATQGQILAVTHLAQVASHADHHFQVTKSVEGERTRTQVEELDLDRRVTEVARMLAGQDTTDVARTHAQELLHHAARPAG